jgi:hypothetical protein
MRPAGDRWQPVTTAARGARATRRPLAVLAALAVLAGAGPLGCAGWSWPGWPWGGDDLRGDPDHGVEIVDFRGVTDFHARALAFYERLSYRRVNTYATYQDRVLREYFQTPGAFDDYYADLAASLDEAHFEQNRPVGVEVAEFIFDAPGRARVKVRFVGEDGLPLRPGKTDALREDHWERRDGTWWIRPDKI